MEVSGLPESSPDAALSPAQQVAQEMGNVLSMQYSPEFQEDKRSWVLDWLLIQGDTGLWVPD